MTADLELVSRLQTLDLKIAELQREVALGQMLDVANATAHETLSALKTGSYSVRGPLLLGIDTPIGLAIVRELGEHSVEVHGIGRSRSGCGITA